MATLSTFFDMVYVYVTLLGSGTGPFTLGSAVQGFQTAAAAGITNGTPVSYRATDGTNWETAHGTVSVSGGTYSLSRGGDTTKSSNSNALVSFGSGVTVVITELSQDLNTLVSAGAAQSLTSAQQQQARTNLSYNPNLFSQPAGSYTFPSLTGDIASGEMFGFGVSGNADWQFTPSRSGLVLVFVTYGVYSTAPNGSTFGYTLNYGTGSPPVNTAATIGTALGQVHNWLWEGVEFSDILIGSATLTPGTTYWFDIEGRITVSYNMYVANGSLNIVEF